MAIKTADYTNQMKDPKEARAMEQALEPFNGVTAGTRTVSKALIVDSSGTLDALDIDALSLGGTVVSRTAAEVNLLLQCETAQYSVKAGGYNLDATEFGIATGLSSIIAVATSIRSTSAPSNVIAVTWEASAGTLALYGWKYTTSTTNTLVAATATASVKYIAIGPQA